MVHSVNTNIFCFKIIQLLLNFEQQIYCHYMEFTYWSKRKTEIASSGGSSITYIDYFAFFS